MKENIVTMALIVAVVVLGALLWKSHTQLTDQHRAIVTALAAAGILEQGENGEVLINRTVRLKDIPNQQ